MRSDIVWNWADLDAFKAQLASFNWEYSYSDDARTWREGSHSAAMLRAGLEHADRLAFRIAHDTYHEEKAARIAANAENYARYCREITERSAWYALPLSVRPVRWNVDAYKARG